MDLPKYLIIQKLNYQQNNLKKNELPMSST